MLDHIKNTLSAAAVLRDILLPRLISGQLRLPEAAEAPASASA
jgi:hypothetical protein